MRRTIKVLSVLMAAFMLVASANLTALAQDEQITLQVWVPGTFPKGQETYETIFEKYNERYPNVKIELSLIDWGTYYQKLDTAAAGGMLPDVYGLGAGGIGTRVMADLVLPLNDYLGSEWSGWTDIPQKLLDYGSLNGKLYGLMFPDVHLMFYRKDMFREAGLDPENPPATPEAFLDAARKLTVKENGSTVRTGYELYYKNQDYSLLEWSAIFGGRGFWSDEYEPQYTSEPFMKAAELMEIVYKEGLTLPSDRLTTTTTLFENGLAAMTICSAANYVRMQDLPYVDEIGICLPPNGQVAAGATYFVAYAETKHPQETVALLDAMTCEEAMMPTYLNLGFPVIRKSVNEDFWAASPVNRSISDAMEVMTMPGKMYDKQGAVWQPMSEQLEQLAYGNIDAKTAMQNAQDEAIRRRDRLIDQENGE